MNTTTQRIDAADVKQRLAGRGAEALQHIGIAAEYLTGKNCPCPKCGGTDRFRFDRAKEFCYCNQCHNTGNGDIIANAQWFTGSGFRETLETLANFAGMAAPAAKPKPTSKPKKTYPDAQQAMAAANWQGLEVEKLHEYLSRAGDLLAVVMRLLDANGKKTFLPVMQQQDGQWIVGTIDPRPLYGLELLDSPELVIVCEGEKTANALRSLGFVAITWMSGAQSWTKADWQPLVNCGAALIVLLPDNDKPGRAAMAGIAKHLLALCSDLQTKIVDVPGIVKLGEGMDAADLVEKYEGDTETPKRLILEAIEAAELSKPEETKPTKQMPATGQGIANAVRKTFTNEKGKEVEYYEPLGMEEIKQSLFATTGDWPRSTGGALFVDSAERGITLLKSTSALFGWTASTVGPNRWHQTLGAVTKEEFNSDLKRTCIQYAAAESYPHEPRMPDHYYAQSCQWDKGGDGQYLQELVSFFCPETPYDAELIRAFMVTIVAGLPGGKRPAWTVTTDDGPGTGKSTIAIKTSQIFGGYIDVDRSESGAEIKTRILSPDALGKRLILIDNIRSDCFAWGEVESMITSPVISGRAMYRGEGAIPNVLTWCLTLNSGNLSADMATRCIVIRVTRPTDTGGWDDRVDSFIEKHRWEIIGDCLAILRRPPVKMAKHSRWASWEQLVLSKMKDPDELARVILDRQRGFDVDKDEAAEIEDAFRGNLEMLQYDLGTKVIFIPSAVCAEWYGQALGTRVSRTKASRALNDMIKKGRLQHLTENDCGSRGRGFLWYGESPDSEQPETDVPFRLAKLRKADKQT